MEDILGLLSEHLKKYEWFYDVGLDEYNRPTVYVKYMSSDVFNAVPDKCYGKQVMLHFAGYKTANKNNFLNTQEDELLVLTNKIYKITKNCGLNIFKDIFFEEHDNVNSITNLSEKFPDTRNKVSELYDEYGFDVIYDIISSKI